MEKITAIIQSSWRSMTLEYKSLIKMTNNKTVLEMIIDGLRKMDIVDKIILATSDDPGDRSLVEEAERLGLEVYAGETINVLGRIKNACRPYPGAILKVNGNKPLFDYIEAKKMIVDHIDNNYEYSYNGHYYGVVYGTDCDVFNSKIFDKIDIEKLSGEELESGTIYIQANPQHFNINARKFDNSKPDYRLILENKKDIEVINAVLKDIDMITNEKIIYFLDENPIVANHNKIKQRSEVGLNKIILFPDKIKAINNIDLDRLDYSYPISVEMSFTNRCNFSCIWCSDRALRARQEDDMSLETIKMLAEDLALHGTKGITIEGGGEPTIVNYFKEAIGIFKKEGLALGLITNGSIRLTEDIVDQFDWIRVSLDVSCQKEMGNLKGYKKYEDVISNIVYYARHKPIVGIGYVATNRNISQIESLILRIRETGLSYIQFRPVIDHPELKTDYDFEYLKKYQTFFFSVITDGMKENVIRGNNNIGCKSHSLSTVITADGSVYLCGRLNIYPWVKAIGNINKQSFYEIWHGEERKKQARMVQDEDFCAQHCPECRITKFNIGFDNANKLKTVNFI